jgi:hypothetical protein
MSSQHDVKELLVIRQRHAGLGLALALLLAACSSDSSGVKSSVSAQSTGSSVAAGGTVPGTTASASTSPANSSVTSDSVPGETTTVPVAVVDVKIQPGTATDGFEGAVADVSDRRCDSTDGKWTVTGKVTNPTNAAVNYRIYMSFIDASGATPGLLEVDVDHVVAGASADWTGSLDIGLDDLKCVPRVERVAVG